MTDPLSPEEIDRYRRHIVLAEIGGAGQQKLKQANVLIVGAGGLGAPVIQYLAAAGIGHIGVLDDDTVSLSNLQRQIIHDTAGIGTSKIASAEVAVGRLNPHVRFTGIAERLGAENAARLLAGYDLLVDGSDNFDTRYASADAAETARIPLVTGAVGRFEGSLTVLKPYETGPDGILNPGYRDLFPSAPPPAGPRAAKPGLAEKSLCTAPLFLLPHGEKGQVDSLLLRDGESTPFAAGISASRTARPAHHRAAGGRPAARLRP